VVNWVIGGENFNEKYPNLLIVIALTNVMGWEARLKEFRCDETLCHMIPFVVA
jgi:hypothetical protein